MEQVNEKNKRLVQSLSKKDFFHEYELLLKEVKTPPIFLLLIKSFIRIGGGIEEAESNDAREIKTKAGSNA